RVLYGLVLANRTIEDDTRFRVVRSARKRKLTQPNRLGGNEDPFWIHTVQDVLEPLAFLADAILRRHFKVFEEQLIGVDNLSPHLLDLMDLDPATIKIRVEQAKTKGWLRYFLNRSGSGKQQDFIRDLRR